jgi:ubiquinone/menaquinone biosynthesis C-methylase UbiE
MDIKEVYKRRFATDIEFRNAMWSILCRDYFQKWVSKDSKILEIAAGYCEFINHIQAGKKFALDINPDVKKFADPDVEVIIGKSEKINPIKDNSIDVVFVSNFFEHISKASIDATLKEIYRILVPNGKLIILQPNIRFCYKDYWMFFDHITPIDDRALVEILEITKFKMIKVLPQFLPYSTKSALPKSLLLIKLYLHMPLIWKFFGKQALIICEKR